MKQHDKLPFLNGMSCRNWVFWNSCTHLCSSRNLAGILVLFGDQKLNPNNPLAYKKNRCIMSALPTLSRFFTYQFCLWMHTKALKYIFADEENSISFVIPDKQVMWTSTRWIMDAMTTFQKLFQVVHLINIAINLSLHITYCVYKERSFALLGPWLGRHWLQQNKYFPLIFVNICSPYCKLSFLERHTQQMDKSWF